MRIRMECASEGGAAARRGSGEGTVKIFDTDKAWPTVADRLPESRPKRDGLIQIPAGFV